MIPAHNSIIDTPTQATLPLLDGVSHARSDRSSASSMFDLSTDTVGVPYNSSSNDFSLPNSTKNSYPLLPVSGSSVLLVLNQLAVMTQNGIELADALANVMKHCKDDRLARSLAQIYEAVSGGNTFSAAVAAHGKYFPPTLSPMLAAAEATGEVPETLGKVCQRMRGELEMRGTLIGAMIYPAILLGASGIVLAALILGVLPQFSKVFTSMGRPIPATTQFLLSLGDVCRDHWIWIALLASSLVVGFIYCRHQSFVRRPLGRFLMYGPLIRDAYRLLAAGRNFRTIAGMVRGGVPLMQSVQLARQATRDTYWQDLLLRIETNLIDGLSASAALTTVDFLPPEAPQMMATGERTGRIGEVLEDIGSFYELEGGRKLKRLVVAFEPFIILCMGVLVAGIVMSIMLPLLDVSTISR